MTEHPLTDEICEEISLRGISITMPIERNNMRAATDWQLEQVIEWMKANLMNHDSHESYDYLYDDFSNAYIKEDELLKDLREAMRPTQEDN
jgi:hypothetical protein